MGDAILVLAKDSEELYRMWQHIWFAIHYLAGTLAVVAGLVAAAGTAKESPTWIRRFVWAWALSASLMSGVVTFLEPHQKAQSYKNAEYALKLAISDFEDKRIKSEQLRGAVEHAQQVVLGSDKSVTPAKKADK